MFDISVDIGIDRSSTCYPGTVGSNELFVAQRGDTLTTEHIRNWGNFKDERGSNKNTLLIVL